MSEDTTVEIPDPPPIDPLRQLVYQLVGEIVMVGARSEWIIDRMANDFAKSTQVWAAQQWDDIKAQLRTRGLTGALQKELQAVKAYFGVRKIAAHGSMITVTVAETVQLFRVSRGPLEAFTLDDLKRDVAKARDGLASVQSVGRALDADDPTVWANVNKTLKLILIGPAS